MKNKLIKKLPDKSGVYFFKRGKQILYIGKATSLRSRVRSYLSKTVFDTRGPLVGKMMEEADKIDFQTTDNVLEALILEANLIKKYQPKYNTKEKSDKSFLSVVITAEALPRVITIRTHSLKRSSNVLTNFRISKTYGPFGSGSQLREALKIIRRIFPFLDEKYKHNYRFYEQVSLVPDISSAEGIKQYKSNIKNLKLFFEGKKKRILKNLERQMKECAKKKEFEKAGEAKRQLFALQHINDVALLKNYSSTPSDFSSLRPSPTGRDPRELKIARGVARIEAYDIAHLSGKNMVGVMVVVENGKPSKNEYRRFKIRTQKNANDTGALAEVIERRLSHSEWRTPYLIVVDGSTAQINAAKKVLHKNGIDIPVVSVVKDEHHRPRSIGGDKTFARKYESEILLANNEAHRFAIAYHKNLRGKSFLK